MAQAPKGITPARPKSKDDKTDKAKDKAVAAASDFGSHANMTNEELTGKIVAEKQPDADAWVILTDERGHYATRKSRIDSGLADPNRYSDTTVRDQLVKELTTA